MQVEASVREYRTVIVPQLLEMLPKFQEGDIAVIERLAKCRCLYRDGKEMLIVLRFGKVEYGPVCLTYESSPSYGGQTNG